MLPPGHIAAGYLLATALLNFTQPGFDTQQTAQLLALGAFFGFAPDLDVFFSFARGKSVSVPLMKHNHRFYWSHTPLPWLIVSLLIYFLASDPFLKYVGLMIWLGSWSHFALDSIIFGIMWLWPFSNKHFALSKNKNDIMAGEQTGLGFFRSWLAFLKNWQRDYRINLILEFIIIVSAIITFINYYG